MRCWMQERNPDTGLRKIDDQDALARNDNEQEEDDQEEEANEVEENKEPNQNLNEQGVEGQAEDYINTDASPEERQEEFIEMMKQRFVDGEDPDFDYDAFDTSKLYDP